MLHFIQTCGLFGLPLVLLTLLELGLIIGFAARIAKGSFAPGPAFESGLNAILFWGGIAVVMGLLGQSMGMYNGLNAIARAKEISPAVVAQGFAESFTTTLFGLGILFGAAIAWLILRTWYRRTIREIARA